MSPNTRILLVVDWSADPERVIAECLALATRQPAEFGVLVPARLHGVDWLGDPDASCPCAQRQLERITELGEHAGLRISPIGVGAPEALTAVGDALAKWRADEILLARARRTAPRPFGLARRAQRATGLPVAAADLRNGARRRGHCDLPRQTLVAAGT